MLKNHYRRSFLAAAIPVMIQGEDADELLDEVYAQGITTFDTAENYGLSEASLGQLLKNRGNRKKS